MSEGKDTARGNSLYIQVAVGISAFLLPFMASSVNIALPSIGRELSMDAVLLGWVVTGFLLISAALQVPFGRLGDILGQRRVFLIGAAVYVVASILLSFSPNAAFLLVGRILQGTGAAMQGSTGVAMLTASLPPRERGRALGINTAAIYAGLSLGPVLGGVLTQNFGWRSIFYVTVPLMAAGIGLVWLRVKHEAGQARGERLDLPGSVLFCLSLVALMYGFTELPDTAGIITMAAGLVLSGAFIWWERRADSPVPDLTLFRNLGFALSVVAALIQYSATFAVGFLLSLYLQYIKALTPQEAGLVLIAQPVMQVIFSPLAGRFSDKIEPRFLATTGIGLSVIGLGLLITLGDTTPVAFLTGVLLLLGTGFGLFSAPNTNAVMSSVDRKSLGVAAGVLGSFRSLGMAVSLGIVMVVFATVIGRVQVTPEVYPRFLESVRVLFIIFTALSVIGTAASLFRGNVQPSPAKPGSA